MENTYHEQSAASKLEHCGRCQSINLQEREKPPHLGLYCNDYRAWIRWIPQARLKLAAVDPGGHSAAEVEPKPPLPEEPAPSTCGHCPEMDRLAMAMASIERELIIIVRALCNGVRQ